MRRGGVPCDPRPVLCGGAALPRFSADRGCRGRSFIGRSTAMVHRGTEHASARMTRRMRLGQESRAARQGNTPRTLATEIATELGRTGWDQTTRCDESTPESQESCHFLGPVRTCWDAEIEIKIRCSQIEKCLGWHGRLKLSVRWGYAVTGPSERRLGRLVPTADLHVRRSQAIEAVPFELPLPGANFLDRQGVALESLVERQRAAGAALPIGRLSAGLSTAGC